jgi:hypothetical protein
MFPALEQNGPILALGNIRKTTPWMWVSGRNLETNTMANQAETPDPKPTGKEETHALHVARVPLKAWQRAKGNAVASNMPFREYVIRLLEQSTPISQDFSPTTGSNLGASKVE